VEERWSVKNDTLSADCVPFNNFIDGNMLVDLPLHGRKYTWCKGDWKSMSRLDKFLHLEEWCSD